MHFPPGTPNLLEGGDVKTTMTYRFLAQRDPSKSSLPILAMAERLMREGQVGMRLGITAAEAEDAFDALNRFASTAWRHFDYAEMEVRLLALGANLRNKRKTWEAPEFQQRRETSTEPAGRPSAKQKALNRKKAKAAKKARRK